MQSRQFAIQLGARLFDERSDLGIARTVAAHKVGISAETLARYEDGTRVPPSDVLVALCKALRVDIKDLLTFAFEEEVVA